MDFLRTKLLAIATLVVQASLSVAGHSWSFSSGKFDRDLSVNRVLAKKPLSASDLLQIRFTQERADQILREQQKDQDCNWALHLLKSMRNLEMDLGRSLTASEIEGVYSYFPPIFSFVELQPLAIDKDTILLTILSRRSLQDLKRDLKEGRKKFTKWKMSEIVRILQEIADKERKENTVFNQRKRVSEFIASSADLD